MDFDLHFHDLRGTAVTSLARADCSTAQIAPRLERAKYRKRLYHSISKDLEVKKNGKYLAEMGKSAEAMGYFSRFLIRSW